MPRVIKVIEHEEVMGKGTPDDPHRTYKKYFSLEGKLIGEAATEEFNEIDLDKKAWNKANRGSQR